MPPSPSRPIPVPVLAAALALGCAAEVERPATANCTAEARYDEEGDGLVDYTIVTTYDASGRVTGTVTEEAGGTFSQRSTYDGWGNLVDHRWDDDGDGEWDHVRTYTFALRLPLTYSVDDETYATWTYDEGLLVHEQDGPDIDISYEYDAERRLVVADEIQAGDAGEVYDTFHTRWDYDAMDRVTSTTREHVGMDGTATTTVSDYTWDDEGLAIHALTTDDESGATTTERTDRWDSEDRLLGFTYDGDGDGVTDAVLEVVYGEFGVDWWTYQTEADPPNRTEYAYDASGLRARETVDGDSDGVVDATTTWTYDDRGREVASTYENIDGEASSSSTAWTCPGEDAS